MRLAPFSRICIDVFSIAYDFTPSTAGAIPRGWCRAGGRGRAGGRRRVRGRGRVHGRGSVRGRGKLAGEATTGHCSFNQCTSKRSRHKSFWGQVPTGSEVIDGRHEE